MTTKESIAFGEKMLEKYLRWLVEIKSAIDNLRVVPNEALRLLLEIQNDDISERAINTEKKLVTLRKQYEQEMEVASSECNFHMARIIADAIPYIGKEPIGITSDIEALVNEYNANREDMYQEAKNHIYFRIKLHVQFMKKTFNKEK